MVRENFPLDELIEDATPPEEVLILGHESDVSVPVRCAICGIPAGDAVSLPGGYANPVCDDCDQLATNADGEVPWEGWPPGEEPEPRTDPIQLAPDHGENPVCIMGAKCWRRYRFGGWITRRDAFDCDTLEEFREKHRHDTSWVHAFNSPRPNGVTLPDGCEERIATRRAVADLRNEVGSLDPTEVSEQQFQSLLSRAENAPFEIKTDLLEQYADPEELLKEISWNALDYIRESSRLGAFCERYLHDEQLLDHD